MSCSITDCFRPVLAKRMCAMHYERSRRGADMHAKPIKEMAKIERFMLHVGGYTDAGCREWTAGKDQQGYGIFHDERSVRAHRWIYTYCKGDIPNGLFICHSCDNPSCVEMSHLFLGTAKENSQDMVKKGRWVCRWRKRDLQA